MGDYTKLTQDQLREILQHYNIGDLLQFKSLSLGISNSNYRVQTTQDTYLLKVSNDKNKIQIQQEMDILSALKKKGFKFSIAPLSTNSKKTVYEIKNLHGVLFPFVQGIPPGPADSTCCEIGKGIAALHSIEWSDREMQAIRKHEEVGFPVNVINKYAQSDICPPDFRESFFTLFPDGFRVYRETDFKCGLVYGDLYYDNILFDQNHLKAILDFEQAGIDQLVFDLGICISGTCLEKGRIHPALIDSLLEGYQSVRPLPTEERAHLKEAILLGLYSIALWRIKRFKEGALDRKMANSYQDLLNRALSFFEMEWA